MGTEGLQLQDQTSWSPWREEGVPSSGCCRGHGSWAWSGPKGNQPGICLVPSAAHTHKGTDRQTDRESRNPTVQLRGFRQKWEVGKRKFQRLRLGRRRQHTPIEILPVPDAGPSLPTWVKITRFSITQGGTGQTPI